MVPDRDYYMDKDGKLTDDPSKYAAQVAVAGVYLEDRVAKRYGIGSGGDHLIAADEPGAVRRVAKGATSEPSVHISKADEDSGEDVETAEAAEAASPEVEKPKTEAKKPITAGAKKK